MNLLLRNGRPTVRTNGERSGMIPCRPSPTRQKCTVSCFITRFVRGRNQGGEKKGGPRFDKSDYKIVQKLYDVTGFAVHFYSSSSEEEVEILPDVDDGCGRRTGQRKDN
jgi:hypothetical protein